MAMKIDKGLNLYIDISAACNASCPFCIAPTVERRDGAGFWEGLSFGLDFTQKHGGSIQITGGEPSLSRRLSRVLVEVGVRTFHRKVLNSNGCGLSKEMMVQAVGAGITHVNLSRHHYNETKNDEVMQIKPNRLATNVRFEESVNLVQSCGIPVRLNCNLLSGYIDSISEV